ncbi:hypothetical protein TWF191_001817 [Orbilia oligospora]|uniref:Uncharacterized protein n=1 Tax=Orbilia oligospora TaxID=2813651 RepID=A0A7C8UN95_ORBOL|nr:hypothetical protein TWF191_001817 [Orbilia oligospora]
MIYSKAIIFLAFIAATNAYTIKFNVLGFENVSEVHRAEIEMYILEQYEAYVSRGLELGKAQEPFTVDWDGMGVKRIPEKMGYMIPGRVGRERCFNIIPPIFTQRTPEVVVKDRYKINNLREGDEAEYFPPPFLLNPIQRSKNRPGWDPRSPLNALVAPKLPGVDITEITIFSRLDPEAWKTLGPAGPPPLAIAMYSRRDCLSKGNKHTPEAVIRYFDGEGSQFIPMDKLFPKTGILRAQSWEELDANSGLLSLRPAGSTGSDKTAGSNGSGEKLTPTRTDVGDAYLTANGDRPQQYIKDVVEAGYDFEFYMADDALDSKQIMGQSWKGLEDYGYGGPNKLKPRVKTTGLEYLTVDWTPEVNTNSAPNSDLLSTGGIDADGYETVSPGRRKPEGSFEFSVYNPFDEPLPKEKYKPTSVFLKENQDSDESILPPLLPLSSSDEGDTLQLQDASELWAQSNAGAAADPDLDALDLYRFRSGGMTSGGSDPEREDAVGLDILEESYVNELDELE